MFIMNFMTLKNIVILIASVILVFILYAVIQVVRSAPQLSASCAKTMCSQVLLAGREPEDVRSHELQSFLFSNVSVDVNRADMTATASIFGLFKRKAIYREGLGCTLVVGLTEQELRDQKIEPYRSEPVDRSNIPWPMGDKIDGDVPKVNRQKIDQVMDHLFENKDTKPETLPDTHAVVVLYDGKIVAERYADGITKDSKHISFSMAKSFTNALVGILVKEGKLNVNDPAPVEQWKNDERKNIKLVDLMHMTSGLDWEELYDRKSWLSDMMYAHKDTGAFAASFSLVAKPGETFLYSSGTVQIISDIIRRAVGDKTYYQFAYEQLFSKIGMQSAVVEVDAGGTIVGTSYIYATARDYARFGLLFYQNGIWNGEHILPDGWIDFSTAKASGSDGVYGALWWTNKGGNNLHPSGLTFPHLPADTYSAIGIGGQYIMIIPSKKLVVVRLSHARPKAYTQRQELRLGMGAFVTELLKAIPE